MSDIYDTDFPPLEPQPFVTEEGREIERLRAELAAAKRRIAELEAQPLGYGSLLDREDAVLERLAKEGGGA